MTKSEFIEKVLKDYDLSDMDSPSRENGKLHAIMLEAMSYREPLSSELAGLYESHLGWIENEFADACESLSNEMGISDDDATELLAEYAKGI